MCPPGVDQTTRRPQHWQLLAPEKRQALPYQESPWSIVSSDVDPESKFQQCLWGLLARPATFIFSDSGLPLLASVSCGSFDLLSNEILDMVLSHIESKIDLMALGLASTELWRLVLHHIQIQYHDAAASWAGTRLVFQGSYSEDLPDALLNAGNLVQDIVRPTTYARRSTRPSTNARNFYHACAGMARSLTPCELASEYLDAVNLFQRREGTKVGKAMWEVLDRDLRGPEREAEAHQWVLRNLTNREVVFEEVLKRKGSEISLGSVLVKQTTWTSMLRRQVEDMSPWRGEWAGHRFEIITKEVHEREGGVWKDVSVTMVATMEAWLEP